MNEEDKAKLFAEAVKELREIVARGGGDPEQDHVDADEVLCRVISALGGEQIVDAFAAVGKWYA